MCTEFLLELSSFGTSPNTFQCKQQQKKRKKRILQEPNMFQIEKKIVQNFSIFKSPMSHLYQKSTCFCFIIHILKVWGLVSFFFFFFLKNVTKAAFNNKIVNYYQIK